MFLLDRDEGLIGGFLGCRVVNDAGAIDNDIEATEDADGLAYDYWCQAASLRVTAPVSWPGVWLMTSITCFRSLSVRLTCSRKNIRMNR